ncbi:MAG: methyl-accepting chemotaxis protein [Oscillospiraceae bacterium]
MYKNFKIRTKLIIGFGSVSVLALLTIIFALVCMIDVGNQSHQLFVGPYVSTTETLGIKYDLNSIGKDIRSAIIDESYKKYESSIERSTKEIDDRIAKIEAAYTGDIKLVEDVKDAEAALSDERTHVITAIENGEFAKAKKLLDTTYAEKYKITSDATDTLYTTVDERAIAFDWSSQNRVLYSVVICIVLLVVGLVLSIVMALVSTSSITRPMKKIEKAMGEMGNGSLQINVDYQSKDEIGFLAEKVNFVVQCISGIIEDVGFVLGEMADGNFNVKSKIGDLYINDYAPVLGAMRNINTKLSDTLTQINEASEQVSSGSDQVSSGAQALSQGATEQASSVEELAATINEISQQIKSNAANAKEASAITTQAGSEVEVSNQKMQDLIVAMRDISNSSSEIGKVIKTIEDIAFQTNILALNAAVEAARAGAAGKGFAVVADEVRNLASKSAEAAKGTTALIENSIAVVGKGTQLVDDTAKSLITVVDGARDASMIVDKIATASNEQANSIAQVTMGVDQISSVIQTNSATAEESAAASEELSSQAALLKELVSHFKLKKSGSANNAQASATTSSAGGATQFSSSKY